MEEAQILSRLHSISAEIAAGQPPEAVFQAVVEAVKELGFDRVRLDMVSPDGTTIALATSWGFDGDGTGRPVPVSDDPDLVKLFGNPCPQVAGFEGCACETDEEGDRGIVPLVLRGTVIGKLAVDNAASGRPVLSASLHAVLLFAQQAAIAHAMLWAGSLESLQKTTLAVTSVRNRRLLLNTIVEQAAKLLGAKSGGIYEYRPELEELRIIADYNRPQYVGSTLKLGEGMAGRVIRDHRPHMVVPNYNKWEGRADIYKGDRTLEAVLEVPLKWEERYIGVLYVDDEEGRSFSETDIRILGLFADHAAISLTNSNLVLDDEKKLQRLERLARATQEMMGHLDEVSPRNRLDMIARYAADILDAETAGVFLVRSGKLILEASSGQLQEFDPGRVPPLEIHHLPGGGLTGWIAYHRNLFKDHGASLKQHMAVAHTDTHSPSGNCYSLLAIPLLKRLGQDEELVGLIRADNKKGENKKALDTLGFSQEDEWILTIFAEAAIVAIESAELVTRLREQADVRQRLISSSPAGIIAVDREGKVTEFNRQAEQILGYARAEVIGRPVDPLYLDPKEPRLIGKKLHKEPDQHVRDYDTFVLSKSGEAIPIRHSSTWLSDATGERVGSVGYFVDLREQKKLERHERLLLKASNVLVEADELDDGLQRLAEMMVSAMQRSFCGILLMDEDGKALTLRAENVAGDPDWRSRGQSIVLSEWTGLPELLKRGRPWVRERSDLPSRSILERLAALLGFEKEIAMLLVVPLKIGDRVVGQLDFGDLHGEERPSFSKEEINLVSALAAQITVLIQKFQLLETTVRRERLLKALVQASPHIQAGSDIKALQQVIVRLAAELVSCRTGGLLVNLAYLGQLELVAVHGASTHLIGEHVPHEEGMIGKVAREREVAVSLAPQGEQQLFRMLDLKTVAVVPFRRGSGEVEAVLFVGDSDAKDKFSLIDLEILDAFATQATIALETARLMNQEQLYGRQMATLRRISDHIQSADTLENILHSVLTGVTASYGLGFNRAVLMLVDPAGEHLEGAMAIGEIDEEAARSAWTSATEIDDFERYLKQREKKEIAATTLDRKTRGFRLPVSGSGVFSDVLASGKYQRVSAENLDQVPGRFTKLFRVTTPLVVAPLTVKGQAIGILAVDNKFTQTPIGDDLANALMTFAATATVAIDNKRLFDQTRSGADKLMSFYRMSSELTAALAEPRKVLEKIVDQTAAASGAFWVSIVLIDGIGRAFNPIESSRLEQKFSLPIRPDGISMEVMRTGQAVGIENVARMRGRVNSVLMRREVQAAICLPLSLPGKRIGVMWIHYDKPHRFPDSEVAALQLYVNQAAVAYDSGRRIETLEDIRATSTFLAEVDDMRSVLERIVRGARQVLKADEAVLWLYDDKTDHFIPESSTYAGEHPDAWREFQSKGPQQRGTAFRIMDRSWMCTEEVLDATQNEDIGPTTRKFLEAIGGHGFQGVALKVGREKLGALYAIYAKPCRFDEEERETALMYANHAALALKKAKLLDQVRRAREAAEVVARVTLLEDPKHTLLSIAHETREALDCGSVVLHRFDEETGTVIPPAALAGIELLQEETESDHALVLSMVQRDTLCIVQDVQRDDQFRDSPFAQLQSIKSCVAIPLRAAGRKVGVMFVNYGSPRKFTADELTNMGLFANQAAVAIRNIQLFEESTAKLKQQETLAELSKELLLAKSVQETMDSAVIFAARVLETEFANIVLPDQDGRLVFSAAWGWEPEKVRRFILDPGEGSQTGYTIRKQVPVAVYDYDKEKRFKVPPTVFEHRIHSGLSAPMFRDDEIIGAMLVHTKKATRFSEDDGILLSLIANQTAIALEKARQYEASKRRGAYLEALYEVSKSITAQVALGQSQILDEVVQPAMMKIVGLEGAKPLLGTILRYDEDTDELVIVSLYPPERRTEIEGSFGRRRFPRALRKRGERVGITGKSVLTRQTQLFRDATIDPDYIGCPPDTISELAVPLVDRVNDRVIGVLNVESDQRAAFDKEDRIALEALAELVAVALRLEELRTQTTLALMGRGNAMGRHDLIQHVSNLKVKFALLKDDLDRLDAFRPAIGRLTEIQEKLQELTAAEPPSDIGEEVSPIPVNEGLILAYFERTKGRFEPDFRLTTRCDLDDAVLAQGNPQWLHQVLDTLLANCKGARAKNVILGSRPGNRGGYVEIYVEDDGGGLPEGAREWFLRLPAPKRKGSRGTGRALLIAKTIVQSYKGSIYYEELPQGLTMVLSLRLPEAQEEAQTTLSTH